MSDSQAYYLRRSISTDQYEFPSGKYVRGTRNADGTYTIWPPGQEFAFVIGIPRRMLRPVKRYKRVAHRQMRAVQRYHFMLDSAKALERKVDDLVAKIDAGGGQ